jgi:nicotinamide-nucleotide amidase
MDVEIIIIGDEIISGHTIDTNSAYIAKKLVEIGLPVVFKTAVGDNIRHMEEAFNLALRRVDIVIVTGGLGPTDDDVTKRAIVKVFKRNLIFHEDVLEDMKKRFAERGLKMPSINQNQALLPQGATYLPNKTGSAIGIIIEENGKIFISMPGVPREMQIMVDEELIPFLRLRIRQRYLKIIKLRTTGIIESALAEKIKPHIKIPDSIKFAYLPSYGGVDLRIITSGNDKKETDDAAEKLAGQLRELVGKYIYGEDNDTLEAVIGKLLTDRKQTLATAESCTAGLLAGKITDVPGSSVYFDRGFITYTNESKMELLGVPEKTLIDHGAVSTQTAEAMAAGIKEKASADYGVAVTGIAGPDGGTEEKPVGTVFIAVASAKGVVSKKFMMARDREINRNRSVYAALEMLRRVILEIK